MCGIVGVVTFGTFGKEKEKKRQYMIKILSTELLLRTETRGKDATGAAILFNDGKYFGIKRGDQASKFLSKFGTTKECYGGFLKIWDKHESPTRIFLGHCRQGTTGDKEDNVNNHPIKIGNLVGVHNGVIRNDDEIFEKLGCKRDGEVDSEAIFRLFEYYTNKGKEPFTMDMTQSVVNRLEGQFAVMLFNADNPYQLPIFRDGRPIEFIFIKEYGLLFIASEKSFWNSTHFAYERIVHYYDLDIPSLIDCDIETKALPDDSCMIFDLTTEIDKNTEIDDLGEWKKMERLNKIWKSTYGTGYQNRSRAVNYSRTGTHSSTYDNGRPSNNKDGNENKRRVFDSVKNRYVVKTGDKELDDNQSTTILIKSEAKPKTDKDSKDEKKMNPISKWMVKETSSSTNKEGDKTESKILPCKSDKIPVKDFTIYDSKKSESEIASTIGSSTPLPFTRQLTAPDSSKDEDIIDINPEEESFKVIEIPMAKCDPEILEKAVKAYAMLTDEKGYGNTDMDRFLNDVEIKDQSTAESLPILLLANRIFKHAWSQGFVKGYMYSAVKSEETKKSEKEESKTRKREDHIVNLKAMIILLGRFFTETYGARKGRLITSSLAEKSLSSIAKNSQLVDVDKITALCNKHEKEIMGDAIKVITKAQTKKADK